MGRGGGQRRRGAGKGKASELAALFSPNVQGFLMKMSTLLGIFQDPDVDLPLASGFPHPTQSSADGERRDADTKSCSLARGPREKGRWLAPARTHVHQAQPAQYCTPTPPLPQS